MTIKQGLNVSDNWDENGFWDQLNLKYIS